jgi:hypothetical protein
MDSFINYSFLVLRILFAAGLYLFLASALMTMWRRLTAGDRPAEAVPRPSLRLKFVDETFGEHVFNQSQVYLGRASGCECVVEHETVSARHCRFSFHHGHWWLEDAGSKNGTFLNRQRVRQATVLSNRDDLRCGKVELTVSIGKVERE